MHPMLDTLNFKIVAVGQSAAGKTSLIYKYIRGEFRLDYNVTLGVEFYTKIQKIGAQNIQLQIWDTVHTRLLRRGRKLTGRSSEHFIGVQRQCSWCLPSIRKNLLGS